MRMKIVIIVLFCIFCVNLIINNNVYGQELEVRNKEGKLVSSIGGHGQNKFELGASSPYVIMANVIFLILGISWYKKKIPKIVLNVIDLIWSFDVSRKISWIVITILIGMFIGFSIDKIEHPDETSWGDYNGVPNMLHNYKIDSIQNMLLSFRYLLHSISLNVFGNMRIIATVASISLLLVIYAITKEITKKRFAGILGLIILLHSNLFLKYSTTVTYDNLWTLFYVVSLYLIYKKWFISPIFYIMSVFSKALSVLFIPLTLFFIYRLPNKENKKKLIIFYLVILGLMIIWVTKIYQLGLSSFQINEFLTGFSTLGLISNSDKFVTIFLLPTTVGLFLLSRKGYGQSDSLMMLICGFLWFEPFLEGFTEMTNQPYRYIPLIVFFGMSIGLLFSRKSMIRSVNKNYVSSIVFVFTLAIVSINTVLVIFPALIDTY